jgi:O-antigen/teichoic acid export membrane protein
MDPAQSSPGPRRRLLGGLFFQGLSNFSSVITSLLLMPVVIKAAGADTFGAFVVLNTLFTLTAQAFTLGAGYKCRRQLPAAETPAARTALFVPNASLQLLMYAAGALVLWLVLPPLHRLLLKDAPAVAGWVVPLAFGATYLNMLSDDYFRYTHRLKFVALAGGARAVCYAAFVIPLALHADSLTAGQLLAAQAVATLLPAAGLWLIIAREIPLRFRLETWAQHRWDIAFGLPLLTAVLVENLLATSDRYILAALLTPAHVGAYAAAFAVGSLILIVPKVVSAVLPAALSQEVDQGRRAGAVSLFSHVLELYFLLAIPFLAGSFLLARPVLLLLGNAEVAALGGPAVPLVALGSILYGYTWIIYSSLFVEMDTRLWFRANAAAAVVAVLLNLALVFFFRRIEAAAVAMLASYALSTIIIERQRSHEWPVRVRAAILVKGFLATALMSAVVVLLVRWPLLPASVPAALLPTAIGILVYGFTLWGMNVLPIDDLRRILRRPA